MSEDDLLQAIAREIQTLAAAGNDVPSLLRHIQQRNAGKDCKLLSLRCFQKAFDAPIPSISPIAGWGGFGGELSDDQVNSFVLPVLEKFETH